METLAQRGTDAQLLMKPILNLDSDLCSVLSVKVWSHPAQACLHVRWRSHHRAVPAVWSVGIDLLARLPCLSCSSLYALSPLFCQRIPLSYSDPLCLFLIPFFWPARPSRCEITTNAPWQSDTMRSPGPAPSAFNLIWLEERACVCVEVAGGWGVGLGRDESHRCVILHQVVSPSLILPKLLSSLLTQKQ